MEPRLRAVNPKPDRDLLKDFENRDSSYSEFDFYTASRDKKGHKEQINLRVPDGQIRMMWEIVNSFNEYGSVQDFLRDAIIHHMHRRNQQIGSAEIERRLHLDISQAKSQRYLDELAEMSKSVELVEQVLKEAFEARDWMLMQEAVEHGFEVVEELRAPYSIQLKAKIVEWKRRLKQSLETPGME